jgi:hypothetical protein
VQDAPDVFAEIQALELALAPAVEVEAVVVEQADVDRGSTGDVCTCTAETWLWRAQ